MKLEVLFIGDIFRFNTIVQEYILRKITTTLGRVDSIEFIKKSDNDLLVYLEQRCETQQHTIFITTPNNYATIGKMLATVTQDNQVVKENMLIPSQAQLVDPNSYIIHHNDALFNVVIMEEGSTMPNLYKKETEQHATIHIFEEEKELLETLLQPIAQTYNLSFNVTQIVPGWLRVDIINIKFGEVDNFIASMKKLLPTKMIPQENVVAYMIEKLAHAKKKISFAESCTGGLLSYLFTKNNGASVVFDGSLVTYSNELKENWLAVDEETLLNYGAVSTEVVEQMSDGVLSVSGADYAIAVSGIAGDGGGTPQKPVGTVYIGVRSVKTHKEEHLVFQGDRNYVQMQSALYGIKMVLLLDKETFF